MIVDLRSDTVTRPTIKMREAMMAAEVGDDVFDSDPTVNAFQDKVAEMFGMEAALYCPSGTMTNQIAMRSSTQPQDEVICDKLSHIYLYEGGGMMYNSMLSPHLLEGDRGRITAGMVESVIKPDDIHAPVSRFVGVENTMNKGGGAIYDFEEFKRIRKVCDKNNLHFHLDGARLFNALVETPESPEDYGKIFDTISICFSKGLGAPVGSVLLSSRELNKKAKRVRKVFGGGMRQAGILAAACDHALDHHVDRLKEDHARARTIGKICERLPFIENVFPVDTNIVIVELEEGYTESWFLEALKKKGVWAVPFGNRLVRFVTHLDVGDEELEKFEEVLTSF